MVYTHSQEGKGNISLTLADSGVIKFTANKQNLLFTLNDGYSYEEEPRNYGDNDTLFTFQRIAFKKQEIIISLSNYAFKRSDEGRFSDQIMAQNLNQLKNAQDSLDSSYNQVKKFQYRNLVTSGGLTLGKELDTANIGSYTSTAKYDSLFQWESLKEESKSLKIITGRLESAISLLDNFQLEEQQYVYPLRKIKIETFRKFTLSIACLIFFFIGAPIGAIIRKGGLGTPVIVSMLFFVFYWVIDISGKKLAIDGVVSPAMGTLISSIILFPIGVYLTWKSTKDSSLFNADSYILFFEKLMTRINKYKGEK